MSAECHHIETMAWAGETPWHGLGKHVHHDLTPAQMLKEAQLDWTVTKKPVFFKGTDGSDKYTGGCTLVRDSDETTLAPYISDDWNPVQNELAAEFFHEFVMAGDMEMHTAGSLKEGKIVWFLAKVKDSFEPFPGDVVESHLLFTNYHIYGRATDVRFTPTRVVCWNTLSMALRGGEDDMNVRVNHRNVFDIDTVKETMGIAGSKMQVYKEAADFLGSKRYDAESLEDYFHAVFPRTGANAETMLSRNATDAMSVIESQPGAQFGEGSWWQAFNAVTFMTDHMIGRSDAGRLESAWYGRGRQLKINALEKALEMADAS